MPSHAITQLRLQLLHNGYHPLPNLDKRCLAHGWNAPEFVTRELNDERIASWPKRFPDFMATGVRIEGGLAVIDIDVDDQEGVDTLLAEIAVIAPEIHAAAPTRYGKGFKVALFCRTDVTAVDAFNSKHSHKFWRPPDDPDNEADKDKGHGVEIFGGKPTDRGMCSRQFGIYGPHTVDDAGNVVREYVWDENMPALHEVPLNELPLLTVKMAFAIIDAFEAWAAAMGWKQSKTGHDDSDATVKFDIDETTRFDTENSLGGIDYEALCAVAEARQYQVRLSARWIDGSGTVRCMTHWSNKYDCVGIHDFKTAVNHYPKDKAPPPDTIGDELKKLMAAADPTLPKLPRPSDGAPLADKAFWLGCSYGYCALNDTVIELHKAADDCQLKPPAFQRLYRAWREQTIGKKGGIKYTYATAYWEVNPVRLDIEGVRLRPDQPFPLYTEDSRRFKNTYLRPRHEGSGDIQPWLAFMEHLLPSKHEREWFCNWLAHKHINPGVPGVAVIMVAVGPEGPVYGAGRGILRDIVSRLLGPKYVKPIDFDVFTGKSAQGTYTDWGAYATLITVNEAKDTPESGRWSERRAVYERLREIVDPRAIERTFQKKGQQAFTGLSFASYLVFSNNRDALQIPPGDRRMAALANGERMTPAMAEILTAWMEQPGNIAELARWLEARDLSGFDVYDPPATDTKTTMQELARSELDDAFATIRRRIGPRRLFTGELVRTGVLLELADVISPDEVRRWVTRRLRAEAAQVGYQMTPAQGRHKILCWRGQDSSWATNSEVAQDAVRMTIKAVLGGAPEGGAPDFESGLSGV